MIWIRSSGDHARCGSTLSSEELAEVARQHPGLSPCSIMQAHWAAHTDSCFDWTVAHRREARASPFLWQADLIRRGEEGDRPCEVYSSPHLYNTEADFRESCLRWGRDPDAEVARVHAMASAANARIEGGGLL